MALHDLRGRTGLVIQRTSRTEWLGLAVAGIVATALLTWILGVWTDSTVPFWDALTTAICSTHRTPATIT
jgi:nicotinamide riboside transporter PnuC